MKTAVLFDLDGTLTDPKVGIIRCIQHALARLDAPPVETDDLTWCIGPPLAESFPRLLGTHDASRIAEAISHYRDRFREVGLYENAIYPGITSMLEDLIADGRRLFVATSKPRTFATRILEHFDLLSYFETVFGSELDGTRSDKGELLDHAVSQAGLEASRTLMVGDREHDVRGAARAGIPCLGVLYGYGSAQELTSAGAVALASQPEDVARYCLARA